jgi:4-hydroxyphenylacetate 3-monooxygenase
MPKMPERLLEGKKRPFTGAEYINSLRDGREVYIYGERVKDVTTHPAFRNAAVSVAKLYTMRYTIPNPKKLSQRRRIPVLGATRIASSRPRARATT